VLKPDPQSRLDALTLHVIETDVLKLKRPSILKLKHPNVLMIKQPPQQRRVIESERGAVRVGKVFHQTLEETGSTQLKKFWDWTLACISQ